VTMSQPDCVTITNNNMGAARTKDQRDVFEFGRGWKNRVGMKTSPSL
jgi:hypothetical protein